MKTIRIADLERVRASRPAGYVEDVLSSGKIDGAVLLLKDETYFALRDKYKTPARKGKPITPDKWPIWARALAMLAKPEDKGVGDVAARVIGSENSEAFKKFYKLTFRKTCGCNGRQAKWNRDYPLDNKNQE